MYRFLLVFILIASTPFAFSADDNSTEEEGVQGKKGEVHISPITTEEDREQLRKAGPDHITWEHVADVIMLMDPKAHQLLEVPAIRQLLEDQGVRESIVAEGRGKTNEVIWKYIKEDARIIQKMDPTRVPKANKKPNLLDELGYRQNNVIKRIGYNLWSHQIAGFPLEAFVFYAAIGASMYREYYTDSLQGGRRDPRWFENFMYELTSPVGVFSFFCFVLASGITNNLYTQLYASKKIPAAVKVFSSSRERRVWGGSRYYALDGRLSRAVVPSQHFVNQYKYRFIGAFGGQFGMAMGMMASNIVHEGWNVIAHDPNWKNCRDEIIKKQSSEDHNHFCNLAWDQTAETALSWLPGLGSLISASLLSHWLVALSFRIGKGAGRGGAYLLSRTMPKIIPRMVITIPWFYLLKARVLIPGVGKIITAGQVAGTFMFRVFAPRFINLYAFMEMDKLITHPMWEWIAGESLKANRVAGGITDFIEKHTTDIKYHTPWKRCIGEGEEEDCEYHPSVRSIHRTANRFTNWRQHKSAAMYMAYTTWSIYVSTALGSFDMAKKMYKAFFDSKISPTNELNLVKPFDNLEEEEAYHTLDEMLKTINGHILSTGMSEPENLNLNIVSASHSRFLKPITEIQTARRNRLFVLREMFKTADSNVTVEQMKSAYGENWDNTIKTTTDNLKTHSFFKRSVEGCFDYIYQVVNGIKENENDQERFENMGTDLGDSVDESIRSCVEFFETETDLLETQFVVENFGGFLNEHNQRVEYTEDEEAGFLKWYFGQLYTSVQNMRVTFLKENEGSLSADNFSRWVREKLLVFLNENQQNIQAAINLTDDQWRQITYKTLRKEVLMEGSNVGVEQIKPFYGEDWDKALKTTKEFLRKNSPTFPMKELVDGCFERFYHTVEVMKESEHENDQERFRRVRNGLGNLIGRKIKPCVDESSEKSFSGTQFVVENFGGFLDLSNQEVEYTKDEKYFLYWYFGQLHNSVMDMSLIFVPENKGSLSASELYDWIEWRLLPFLKKNEERLQAAMNLTDYQLEHIAFKFLRDKVLAAGVEYLNSLVQGEIELEVRYSSVREPFVKDEDVDPKLQRAHYYLGADNIYAQLYLYSHQITPRTQGMYEVERFNKIYNTKEEHSDIDYHPSRMSGLRTPDIVDFIIASAVCGPNPEAEEYQTINASIKKVLSAETVRARAPEMTVVPNPAYTLETQFPGQNMDGILAQMPVFDRNIVGASYSFFPPRIVTGLEESTRRAICHGSFRMAGGRNGTSMSAVVEDIYDGYFPAKLTGNSYFFGLVKTLEADEDRVYSNLLHLVLDHIEAPSSMEEFDKWWEQKVQPQIDIFVKAAEREYNVVMNDRFMIPFFASKVKDIEMISRSPHSSDECEDYSAPMTRWDLVFHDLSFFKPWATMESEQYINNLGGRRKMGCVQVNEYSTGLPRGLFQSIYLELHYWADIILHFAEIRKKEHPDEEIRNRVVPEDARGHLGSLIQKFNNLDDCLNAGPKERDKSLWNNFWDEFLWGESITREKVKVCQDWVEDFMKSENKKAIQEDITNIMDSLNLSQSQLQAIKAPNFLGEPKTDEETQELLRKASTAFKYNIDFTGTEYEMKEYEMKINSIIENPELTNEEKTAELVQLVGYMADSPEMEQQIGSILVNPKLTDEEKKTMMTQLLVRILVAAGLGEEAEAEGERIAALPDQLLNFALSRLEYLATEEATMYMGIIMPLMENDQVKQNIHNPLDNQPNIPNPFNM